MSHMCLSRYGGFIVTGGFDSNAYPRQYFGAASSGGVAVVTTGGLSTHCYTGGTVLCDASNCESCIKGGDNVAGSYT
jgi:hypothetical protein